MKRWLKNLSSYLNKDRSFFFEIEKIIDTKPINVEFYQLALIHSSASKETKGQRVNNQRLEYLGDAILGAIVADYLYHKYPKSGEGFLTSMRSKIVSRKNLNYVATAIGVQKLVVKNTPRNMYAKSIYGDALEAFIGAIYLDLGFEACHRFICQKILKEVVNLNTLKHSIASHKGALLEWAQKEKKSLAFELVKEWGESHDKKYEIAIKIDDTIISIGQGSSKKRAEEAAAKEAYKTIISS